MNRYADHDVIMTTLNMLRLYLYANHPTKFGEDRMKNEEVIILKKQNYARTRAVVGTAQPLGSVLHEALKYEDYLDAFTISNN